MTQENKTFEQKLLDEVERRVELISDRFKHHLRSKMVGNLKRNPHVSLSEHNYVGVNLNMISIENSLRDIIGHMSDTNLHRLFTFDRFNVDDVICNILRPHWNYRVISTPSQMEEDLDVYVLRSVNTGEILMLHLKRERLTDWSLVKNEEVPPNEDPEEEETEGDEQEGNTEPDTEATEPEEEGSGDDPVDPETP